MEQLRKAIGLADVCELMKHAFGYPDEALADALVSNAFRDDMRVCLADACAPAVVIDRICAKFDIFPLGDSEVLLDSLKRDFTRLYLIPGTEALVFPYESPFRFVADKREGQPSLFGSSIAHDVKNRMREAGVLPKTAQTEPSDSVWNEFEFLSYLYGNVAAALREDDGSREALWRERLSLFYETHAVRWLPDFMAKTTEAIAANDIGPEYGVFAECGIAVLELITQDVKTAPLNR